MSFLDCSDAIPLFNCPSIFCIAYFKSFKSLKIAGDSISRIKTKPWLLWLSERPRRLTWEPRLAATRLVATTRTLITRLGTSSNPISRCYDAWGTILVVYSTRITEHLERCLSPRRNGSRLDSIRTSKRTTCSTICTEVSCFDSINVSLLLQNCMDVVKPSVIVHVAEKYLQLAATNQHDGGSYNTYTR